MNVQENKPEGTWSVIQCMAHDCLTRAIEIRDLARKLEIRVLVPTPASATTGPTQGDPEPTAIFPSLIYFFNKMEEAQHETKDSLIFLNKETE